MEFPEGRCASPRARDPYVSNAKRSDGCALDFAAGVSIRADWKSAMSDQEAATSVIGDSLMCLCRLHIAQWRMGHVVIWRRFRGPASGSGASRGGKGWGGQGRSRWRAVVDKK